MSIIDINFRKSNFISGHVFFMHINFAKLGYSSSTRVINSKIVSGFSVPLYVNYSVLV